MMIGPLQFDFLSAVWIMQLPQWLLQHLTPLSLVVLGYLVEKHYVSRPAIFANAIAVNVHVRDMVAPGQLIVLYANLGLVMAGVAIYTYAAEDSLSGTYYDVAQVYSSVIVAGVILLV